MLQATGMATWHNMTIGMDTGIISQAVEVQQVQHVGGRFRWCADAAGCHVEAQLPATT